MNNDLRYYGNPMNWESTKGDIISREQIRKSLNEAFGCENATKYGNQNAEQQNVSYSTLMLYEIADIVDDCCDNAPTVFDCRSCKNNGNERYCLDCHDYCNFVRYEARPQGEWIDTGSGQECNVCHEIQCGYDNFRHFCANCGADMRKGGAENE